MRRLPLVIVVSLVLAGAAYAGYWFYTARALRDQLATARAGETYQLAWRAVEIGGFPWAFRLRFADIALQGSAPVPYVATSAAVIATAAPFDLRDWHVDAPEGVRLEAPALAAGLDAAALDGEVATGGEDTVIALTGHDLAGRGAALGFAAERLTARVTVPRHPPESHRDTAFAVSASLLEAAFPHAPLAQRVDALSLEATFRGRLPPGPLGRGLALWRDDGGTLDLERLHLAWGGADIDLAGTLALDAALQPIGALTTTIVGADKLVDAAVAAGALEARHAGTVKSVLRAISSPADGGAGLHVPLTLQDQRLYIGPATIAVLPRLTWP
jgi:hypothetical protein